MQIKHIFPTVYSRFDSNGELVLKNEETNEAFALKGDSLHAIGKFPVVSNYNTLYGFDMISIVNSLIVSQSYEAIIYGDSKINEVITFNLKDGTINSRYKDNIMLSGISVDDNKLFATFNDNDDNKECFCLYNFIERSKDVIIEKRLDLNSYIRFSNYSSHVMIIDKNFLISLIDITKNKICFEINISQYLVPSPQYANGEPMYQNQVEKVLYCKKNEVIVVFLLPYKLLGINAQDGQVLWEVDYPLNSKQMHLEEESGLLYIVESFFTTDKANVVRCNIINTKDGKLRFERDLDYIDIYKGKIGISSALCFGGIYKDYLYFSFFNGELFKLQKDTGEIIERYKHNRPFYAPPQIIGNRLFVSEDTDSKKNQQRLLVFDL